MDNLPKIKMCSERNRYTVQAYDDRFAVCTKPLNAQATYLYFVSDLKEGVRGPSNFVFGHPFDEELNTKAGAEKLLLMFQSGEAQHSRRRRPMRLTDKETAQFVALKDRVS